MKRYEECLLNKRGYCFKKAGKEFHYQCTGIDELTSK